MSLDVLQNRAVVLAKFDLENGGRQTMTAAGKLDRPLPQEKACESSSPMGI
jgi:hypothetical protein